MIRCIKEDGRINPLLVQLYSMVEAAGTERIPAAISPERFLELFSELIDSIQIPNGKFWKAPNQRELSVLKECDLLSDVVLDEHAEISCAVLFAMNPPAFRRMLQFMEQRMNHLEFRKIFLFSRNAIFAGDELADLKFELEHGPLRHMVLEQQWISRRIEDETLQLVPVKILSVNPWGSDDAINPASVFETYAQAMLQMPHPVPRKAAFVFPQPALQMMSAYAQEHHASWQPLFVGPSPLPESPIGQYLSALRRVLHEEVQSRCAVMK